MLSYHAVAARALVVLVLAQGIDPFPLVLPHVAALGEAVSPVAFRFLTHGLAACGYLFVLVGPFARTGALLAGVAHLANHQAIDQ